MSTSVTPDAFLAALTKWGVKWRFYKDRADWLAHNRNGAGNNIRATAGGFGPLRGVAAHNTASTSQTGMLAYLYSGDSARSLPGPLCNWAILKTGEVVLMGWGTSNATGPGDPKPDSLVRNNAMPLDREITPTTAGPSDPRAILYAPYYLGFESCYASEGPTDAQYKAMVATTVAALDAMGGPADGYGGGSVVAHRELTTTRSDPQGVPKNGQFRRDVNALFKAGPPGAPTPTPAPTTPEVPVALKTVTTKLTVDREAVTKGEAVNLTASLPKGIAGRFVFEWQAADGSWSRGGFPSGGVVRVDPTKGSVTITNRPSRNVNYRIGFDPDDAAYANGNYSSHATVVVVDLVRLLTEHRDALAELAGLKAQVAELTATPEPAQTIPGDSTP